MRLRGARRGVCIALVLAGLPGASTVLSAQGSQGLTIEEAERLAQASSEAVRIRELAVQKSRLSVDEASGRAWPHVDMQVSGSYLLNPPTG